jgi:hypothetical protein
MMVTNSVLQGTVKMTDVINCCHAAQEQDGHAGTMAIKMTHINRQKCACTTVTTVLRVMHVRLVHAEFAQDRGRTGVHSKRQKKRLKSSVERECGKEEETGRGSIDELMR